MGSCWFLVSVHTYWLDKISVEPDLGEPAGRRLIENCTDEAIEVYGEACPELTVRQCGPEGEHERAKYRDIWEYRDEANSIKATFDLSFCSPSGRGSTVSYMKSGFWLSYGAGVIFGSLLSDARGRIFALMLLLTISLVGGLGIAMSRSLLEFRIARSVNGIGIGGLGMVAFVLSLESMSRGARKWSAFFMESYFLAGGLFATALSVEVPDWRMYSWVLCALCLPYYFIPFWVFESPKWFASRGEAERVYAAMRRIVAINRQALLPPPTGKNTRESEMFEALEPEPEGWTTLVHHLVLPRLMVILPLWLVLAFSYYGMLDFRRKPFFVMHPVQEQVFAVATGVPLIALAIYLSGLERFGRRRTIPALLGLSGTALVIASVINREEDPGIGGILYFIASQGSGISFSMTYVWSAELFPNGIRTTAVGLASATGHLGAALAPLVQLLPQGMPYGASLRLLGIPCLLMSALAYLRLPETRGKPLPGYLEDLMPNS